jgi:sugar lactone lactonase YvrE
MKKGLCVRLIVLIACLYSGAVGAQIIRTFAGNGITGYTDSGGVITAAEFNHPWGMAMAGGNLYIADHINSAIRKIGASGIISTYAGNTIYGFSGDGGPATDAMMRRPAGIAADAAGNVFFTDMSDNRIRKIDTSGIITTIAGNGLRGYSGDGSVATNASLNGPAGIALDAVGNIFIADSGNNVIRKIDAAGTITTFAGTGASGYTGDGGPAAAATLSGPLGIATDPAGNLFIADYLNNVVRKVNTSAVISTVAGTGLAGYSGDGGPATAAAFSRPSSLTFDQTGALYITDEGNNMLRMINTDGAIFLLAGNGTAGYSGDGGLGPNAQMYKPMGVVADSNRNVYIADYINSVIRTINMRTANVYSPGSTTDQAVITLYPDPTESKINFMISAPPNTNLEVELQNMIGQTMYRSALTQRTEINVIDFLPGCYLVNYYSHGVIISACRFIKN